MELVDKIGLGAALATVLVALSLIVASLAGALTRYETRPVQLTEGPHQIVRGQGAVSMSDDRVLYSRAGWMNVMDNNTGLKVKVRDNGTFVYDISDLREYKVTSEVLNASISGSLVVWRQDNRIIVRNYINNSEMVLPLPAARPIYRPQIDGDRIVWTDLRNDPQLQDTDVVCDIYLYNLTLGQETRLTTGANHSSKGPPDLWGDLVVWNDNRNGNFSIYGYRFSSGTESKMTNTTSGQYHPRISSRALAWYDDRFAPDMDHMDLFYLDLQTGREVRATMTGMVESFDLWGDRLVWADTSRSEAPGNYGDIFLHNISRNSTKLFYSSDWSQYDPAVWGGRIIWVDDLRSGGEIFLMKKVSRPYIGMDLMTVLLLLLLIGAASCALLAVRRSVKKEEEEIGHYEEKALKRKHGRGLK
jgi:beta propeller repeat protein